MSLNIEHYPSLDFCKKLTEIGFPSTELYFDSHAVDKIDWYGITSDWEYVCPSVMELLDVITEDNHPGIFRRFYEQNYGKDDRMGRKWINSLPDWISREIIWFYENNKKLKFN